MVRRARRPQLGNWRGWRRNCRKWWASSKSGLETELRKLQEENLKLENELRLLRQDPVYLEKVARRKFNKAKENEIVYKVVREGENTPPSG